MRIMSKSEKNTSAAVAAKMDLKNALNVHAHSSTYTKIVDLQLDVAYKVVTLQRITTVYGEAIMAVLNNANGGNGGGDSLLHVYLPRRFNSTLTADVIQRYNNGVGPRLSLVRRHAAEPGSSFTPLEFV